VDAARGGGTSVGGGQSAGGGGPLWCRGSLRSARSLRNGGPWRSRRSLRGLALGSLALWHIIGSPIAGRPRDALVALCLVALVRHGISTIHPLHVGLHGEGVRGTGHLEVFVALLVVQHIVDLLPTLPLHLLEGRLGIDV